MSIYPYHPYHKLSSFGSIEREVKEQPSLLDYSGQEHGGIRPNGATTLEHSNKATPLASPLSRTVVKTDSDPCSRDIDDASCCDNLCNPKRSDGTDKHAGATTTLEALSEGRRQTETMAINRVRRSGAGHGRGELSPPKKANNASEMRREREQEGGGKVVDRSTSGQNTKQCSTYTVRDHHLSNGRHDIGRHYHQYSDGYFTSGYGNVLAKVKTRRSPRSKLPGYLSTSPDSFGAASRWGALSKAHLEFHRLGTAGETGGAHYRSHFYGRCHGPRSGSRILK